MNRHDKRNLERRFNKMDYKQFLAVQQNVEQQIKEEYQKKYILTTICALISEFNFGLDRCVKFLNEFSKQLNGLNEKVITIEDMQETIKQKKLNIMFDLKGLYFTYPNKTKKGETNE